MYQMYFSWKYELPRYIRQRIIYQICPPDSSPVTASGQMKRCGHATSTAWSRRRPGSTLSLFNIPRRRTRLGWGALTWFWVKHNFWFCQQGCTFSSPHKQVKSYITTLYVTCIAQGWWKSTWKKFAASTCSRTWWMSPTWMRGWNKRRSSRGWEFQNYTKCVYLKE